jgi:hypothetical protein
MQGTGMEKEWRTTLLRNIKVKGKDIKYRNSQGWIRNKIKIE